jgi:hypothetical protein
VTPQSSHGRQPHPVQQHRSQQIRPVQGTAGRLLLVLGLAVSFALLGATSALAITRDAVLVRAQTWIDSPVPYSQLSSFGGYRTDCSGYVSMCWQTGTSWNTRTFYKVSHPITLEQLMPGDALLRTGYHIRLFYGWVDAERTRYVAYEQTGPWTMSSIKSIADDLAFGYIPYRYNAIQDSPPPANALRNGSFDVWARGEPVWWSTGGHSHETTTPVARRNDVAKAGRFSLELIDTLTGPRRGSVSVEQTAPVTPDTPYALSAWARTAGDPRSLEMRLRYLDASGGTLLDSRTTGDAWGLDDTGFKQMSLPAASPPQAVTAVVTMRLAGSGDASDTAGSPVIIDEVSLAKPQTAITISTNAATTSIGRTPILSGTVTPVELIGTNTVVWVKKPGRAYYSYSSNRTVYSRYGVPSWQYKYHFKRGMTKGVYYFHATVPDRAGTVGATSQVVAVRLK